MKTGILIVHIGAPRDLAGMKQFLKYMFRDEHIIPAPAPVRYMLSFLISNRRYKKSWANYGFKPSPVEAAGLRVKAALAGQSQFKNTPIELAYSYNNPFIYEGLDKLRKSGCEKIMVLPMYPHYSYCTTGSVEADIEKYKKKHPGLTFQFIERFYEHPDYIEFIKLAIDDARDKNGKEKNPLLLFSAHSIPMKYVERGDRYPEEIENSAKLIADACDLEYRVGYQSQVGKARWVGPVTENLLNEMLEKGHKEVIVIPLSFVCENLETFYDIDQKLIPVAQAEHPQANVYRIYLVDDHEKLVSSLTDSLKKL